MSHLNPLAHALSWVCRSDQRVGPDATEHATAVACDGRAVLIRGASGTGKSSLALQLMAYGAELVADDQVLLRQDAGRIMVSAPTPLRGMIEARGVGLLRATPAPPSLLVCVVDLNTLETDRLPPNRFITVLACVLPLLHRPQGIEFAPALLQFLRAGRIA